MTTIKRRAPKDTGPPPRYTVMASWSQTDERHYWTVIDTTTRTWARGTSGDGYDTAEQATAIRDSLQAKVKA